MARHYFYNTANDDESFDLDGDDGLELTSHPHQMDTDTEVRIAKEQSSVFELLRRESRGNLVLAPDFQRKDVWDKKKQSELIESILMGIPIPLIYLFEDENGIRQIIDGKQRVSALKKYLSDGFPLSELTMFPHLKGLKFSEIPKLLQAKLEDFQLHSYVIQPPTPEFVKFNIFERVNRAGMNLNKQEMRHALYQGKATELIKELAESDAFILSTGGGIRTERMRDRYLVLRFIAFYLFMNDEMPMVEYRSDIDIFLASTMRYINVKASDSLIENVKKACLDGMWNAYNLVGDSAFRFEPKSGLKRRPVNMGLFEMLVYALSYIDANRLTSDYDYVKIINEYKNNLEAVGIFSGSIDTIDYVNIRFELALEITRGLKNAYKY
ncbi:TPA: DUF262 domain-containing protein [Serratia marcescens]|uniref:DUF262 domain-containing protein n=1 Tax=Serratia marcescens TaxID=615 RepID=UPI0013DC8650|nr:DUF262 domain-containing protein [Serratia marcescens]NGH10478.1 DUF262 domain-containing protein [Serratia marcescens]HEI8821273.1 DUF262 domain-containing protein [Serratia marcescens]